MLILQDKLLSKSSQAILDTLQSSVDKGSNYEEKVYLAKILWEKKNSTLAAKSAFLNIRNTLETMCVGPRRCSYCEDSLADEIEHIFPKNLFPEKTFFWPNYLFACGPCNGPKSNAYATIENGQEKEFIRKKNHPVVPPPPGIPALINPREEDPTSLLELDLGGTSSDGLVLQPTFDYLASEDIDTEQIARANYTIRVLGLNREILRKARENAYKGFRARLRELASTIEEGSRKEQIANIWNDLISTPHLTVFFEMRRQHPWLPEINSLFARAPEALHWPITK